MPTCNKCQNHFPNREVVFGKIRVLNNRKFCLKCSPFGAHNTKTSLLENQKYCPKCKKSLSSSLFFSSPSRSISCWCKDCNAKDSKRRANKNKQAAVLYKGGKCQVCGYDRCWAAMDFHHKNRSEKKFSISTLKNRKMDYALQEELDKCILLCCRCHREVEAGVLSCP
jgi:hypothetical protein